MNLGSKVKSLREKRGLTRKQLCENLCDESTIFRLEKNKQLPRIETLEAIAEKMEISMHTLFYPYDVKLVELKKRCRDKVYFEDYQGLKLSLLQLEETIKEYHKSYCQKEMTKFIEWHKGILCQNLTKNIYEAKKCLSTLTSIKYCTNETDIGILNSLGLVYLELGEPSLAIKCLQIAADGLKSIPFVEDLTLSSELGYNRAYYYYVRGDFDEALKKGYKHLEFLQANHINYYLGKTHYLIGSILKSNNQYDCALFQFRKASFAFELEKNHEKGKIVKTAIKSINECIQHSC